MRRGISNDSGRIVRMQENDVMIVFIALLLKQRGSLYRHIYFILTTTTCVEVGNIKRNRQRKFFLKPHEHYTLQRFHINKSFKGMKIFNLCFFF